MTNKILLVDDSVDVQDMVRSILKDIADIDVASSMAGTLQLINESTYDLILMDVGLEDGDGFDLTKKLHEIDSSKDTPIIFLTGKTDIEAKTKGFDLGAEDYIVKPFDREEFRLRVNNRLQKIKSASSGRRYIRGNLKFEVPLQRAFLLKENKNLELTPLEFKLLYTIVSESPGVVSREKLGKVIWGADVHVGRSIDTHVNSLRKKMGSNSSHIETVYGMGYCFSDPN